MLTRYPEHFGALLCAVPVIDMRRSKKLLAGNVIDEYGDPDKPEDWAFLSEISAYHVAAPDKQYPPILLTTSRKDDRVHPAHARKMAAKLQTMGSMKPISMSPPPEAIAPAKTIARPPPFLRLVAPSYAAPLVGTRMIPA
jgi:prolyl oligopeptidase PreP (S9A serine peptidase family)